MAGFDGTLCISSLIDPSEVTVANKAVLDDQVVGSVKWPSLNSSQLPITQCFATRVSVDSLTFHHRVFRRVCELHDR